jgi:hypothetical protein
MYYRANIFNYTCGTEEKKNYYSSLTECRGLEFDVYPNPANEMILVEFLNKSYIGYDIYLYNSLGRVVYKKIDFQENVLRINVSDLKPGVYIVKAYTKWDVFIKKVVKK